MKASEMFEIAQKTYQTRYNSLDKWMEDVVLKKFIEVFPETSVDIPLSELPTTEGVLYHYLLKNGYHVVINHVDKDEYGRDIYGELKTLYTITIPPQGE